MSEFTLTTAAEVETLQKLANTPGQTDELQGGIESLAFALKLGLA
jgi:hypothetical protein